MSRLALKSCLVMSPCADLDPGHPQDLFSRQKGYLEEELDYRKKSQSCMTGRTRKWVGCSGSLDSALQAALPLGGDGVMWGP